MDWTKKKRLQQSFETTILSLKDQPIFIITKDTQLVY
jgi:hypothetical protein